MLFFTYKDYITTTQPTDSLLSMFPNIGMAYVDMSTFPHPWYSRPNDYRMAEREPSTVSD